MSQVRENVLGLPVESGSAFFVKEAASSESGTASISQVALQTSKFVGAQARCEYLMPQMTQLNWALRASRIRYRTAGCCLIRRCKHPILNRR